MVPVPAVPMIVIVMALIIAIVVSILIVVLILIVVSILIVIFRREGRYWKQQSRRYGANERKFANHLVLHFVSFLDAVDRVGLHQSRVIWLEHGLKVIDACCGTEWSCLSDGHLHFCSVIFISSIDRRVSEPLRKSASRSSRDGDHSTTSGKPSWPIGVLKISIALWANRRSTS